jgi:sec-independent protein translocase protein TatA
MGSIGMPELMVILLIVVLVFGAGKLPQIGENLGKAIRNFKGATEREKIEATAKKPEEIAGEDN